jgi:hypothetical protein
MIGYSVCMPREDQVDVTETRRRIAFLWKALDRHDHHIGLLDRKAAMLLILEALLLALPILVLIRVTTAGGRWSDSFALSLAIGAALILVVLVAAACLLLLRTLRPSRSNLYPPDSAGILQYRPNTYDRKEYLELTWTIGASEQWSEVESSTLVARELLRRKARTFSIAVGLIAAQILVILAFAVALAIAI